MAQPLSRRRFFIPPALLGTNYARQIAKREGPRPASRQ
jgi:hypothetical protein